jgi:hypothetical protein
MTEPGETPELLLPRTTGFVLGASVLVVLLLVAAAVFLLEIHWILGGPATD